MGKVMFLTVIMLCSALFTGSGGSPARWIAEPVLEYGKIGFCMEHNAFFTCTGRRIDPKTGELLPQYCAHGALWGFFTFDEASAQYGFYGGDESGGELILYTREEFAANFPFLADSAFFLNTIREGQIDAGGFLRSKRVVALQKGGLFGIVDSGGTIILPFRYQHIMIISDNTAFVKVRGRYGIIEF